MIIVNGWKPLTIITKRSILDVAAALDPPLKARLKVLRSSYLSRQSFRVAIENCEGEIPIKKISASPSIKRTQFPLTLVWASIFHNVQGLSLEQGVINYDLPDQKSP